MLSTELRDRQITVGSATLAALASLVEPLELRVPTDTAVRVTWVLAHALALLRIGGMLTLTQADSELRLRSGLSSLLTGVIDTGRAALPVRVLSRYISAAVSCES